MEPFKLIRDVDLAKGIKTIPLGTFVFEGDNNSLVVGSRVFNDGEPEAISGSVIGKVIRPDGGTVDYDGGKTGNIATITLTEAAFAYPGQLGITIKVVSGEDKITVGSYTVDAKRTDTGTEIDPGSVVPGVDDVIALIGEMEEALEDATTAAEAATEAAENIEAIIDDLPENLDSDAEDVDLDISDQSGNVLVRFAGGHVQTKNFDSSGLSALFAGKQDSLTFDNVPTSGSNNPVKSGGVYSSLAGKVDVQQSTADAGKAMVVGSDGTLTPEDITINVDATLSQQGEAADAKATGDAIAELGEDVETLETAFTKTPAIQDNTAAGTDLDVCDASGNVLARFAGGHVQTKNFDSSSLSSSLAAKVSIQQSSSDAGKAMIVSNDGTLAPAAIPAQVEIDDTLSVSGDAADAKATGDAIGELEDDVGELETAILKTPALLDDSATNTDLDVSDTNGNVILRLKDGHIQTKNFDSESIVKDICYVAPNGSDTNTGTSSAPFATFQHAIDAGYKKIVAASGEYKDQQIIANGVNGLSIICNSNTTETGPFESHARRTRAKIDNSIDVTGLTAYNSIYRTALSVDSDSSFYKVFVSKTLDPVYSGAGYYGRVTTYNAILWEITAGIADCTRLIPKLTLADCEATAGSFHYDGTYLYVNPTGGSLTGKSYKRLNLDTNQYGVDFRNCTDLYVQGIDIAFFPYYDLYFGRCEKVTVKDCCFSFTSYGSAAEVNGGDTAFVSCTAAKAGADGFGIATYGDSSFYDCNAFYCYDDGISHHDAATGVIDGGQWIGCKKGGVTPSYGSNVSVKNVICKGNVYGIYYIQSGDRITDAVLTMQNCLAVDNTRKDIKITGYDVLAHGCAYETKEVDTGATLTEYGNTVIQ